MMDILTKTADKLQSFGLIPEKAKILVAVSGGPDSMVLWNILEKLGIALGVVHCHFGLREEADEEADFVGKLAAEKGHSFHIQYFNTAAEAKATGKSIQMVARDQRYSFFEEVLKANDYDFCATAHHQDDVVETLMMSLFKSTGPAMMWGIPEKRGQFIRPLIDFSKTELLEYAEGNAIEYRTDASNLSDKYLRNLIRHRLVPVLTELNPSWKAALLKKHNYYTEERNELLKLLKSSASGIRTKEEGKWTFELEEGKKLIGEGLLKILISATLEELGMKGNEVAAVLKLLQSESGKMVQTSIADCYRDREKLEIIFTTEGRYTQEESIQLHSQDLPLKTFVLNGKKVVVEVMEIESGAHDKLVFRPGVHFLAFHKIKFPIQFRNWHSGDTMIPLGLKGKKKLSDIFVDNKLSRPEKEQVIVMEDKKGIICVSGFRISETVKLDAQTFKMLKISIKEN